MGTVSAVVVKPAKNRFCRLRPGQLSDHLASPQQHDDRDAAHSEAGCNCRVILGINLHYCRLAGNSFRNCPHRRCE